MSEELTVEKLKELLSPIVTQINAVNNNVLSLQHALEEARRDISDTIKENAVMTEKVNNIKENNDKKHAELKEDIDNCFEYSRKNKEKHEEAINSISSKIDEGSGKLSGIWFAIGGLILIVTFFLSIANFFIKLK
jgi:VIT1/CCC1 family predicted Fe2+/Mn2+ transporter